jgi:GNAT superfamily N-acetyltransferase
VKITFREARAGDIAGLVAMLADDELGSTREDNTDPLNRRYRDAFQNIENDPNNELTVVESTGELVGMLQLTFIPYLTHKGSWRCLIEGVRIAKAHRGKGLGAKFFNWAIDRARERNCAIVQLTSDKQRPDALRFYESLGFEATHEGFKLKLRSD